MHAPHKLKREANREPFGDKSSWIDTATGKIFIAIRMTVLYHATAENDYHSVAVYSDREGKAKEKPLNFRANGIMLACGIKELLIHGDAFLARTYDNTKIAESPWWVLQ